MEATGRVFGHYHIESLIGEGSSARVYKGMHQTLGIPVAVKVLKAAPQDSLSSHLATYRDRFRREARLAARLSHEGIVRVLDFGEEMGSLYLVMEYVDGYSLAEFLRSHGAMGEEMALKVTAYLAGALHAAHAQNIVHRDIKPGNILITRDGWLKISDLGLAKDMDARDMTHADTLLGTPNYMAPECFQGGREAGPQADLYSLGILLFEMLAGRPPFAGSLNQVISGHLHDEPPFALLRGHGEKKRPVSEATIRLLQSLLAKDPARRPGSGNEIAELCRYRLLALTGNERARKPDDGTDDDEDGADKAGPEKVERGEPKSYAGERGMAEPDAGEEKRGAEAAAQEPRDEAGTDERDGEAADSPSEADESGGTGGVRPAPAAGTRTATATAFAKASAVPAAPDNVPASSAGGLRRRNFQVLADSSTFQRLGGFMERNLGSRMSEYQGRKVLHTTGRERMLIWILAILFLGGFVAVYLSSR